MKTKTKKVIITTSLVGLLIAVPNIEYITNTVETLKYNNAICRMLNYDRTNQVIKDFTNSVESNPEFSKKVHYNDELESSYFLERFIPYLEEYSKYMSSTQLITLQKAIEEEYKVKNALISNTQKGLYDIMLSTIGNENGYGNGLNKAYVTFVIKECFGYGSILDEDKLYWLFEYFTNVLPRDKVAELIWTQDLETLKYELQKIYLLDTPDLINELIITIDEANKDGLPYEEQRILITKAENIYKKILKNRIVKDSDFDKTIRGQIIQNYITGNDDYLLFPFLEEKGMTYKISNDKYKVLLLHQVDISPESKLTFSELTLKTANQILFENKTNQEYHKLFDILNFIVKEEYVEKITKENGIDILLEYLDEYFSTKEELAEFIVALNNSNQIASNKYFEILTDKMTYGIIDEQKLIEYEEFKRFYYDNVYINIFRKDGELYYGEDVIKGSPEEENYYYFISDYYFAEIDPTPYFDKIDAKIHDSDLTYVSTENSISKKPMLDYDSTELNVYSRKIAIEHTIINNQHYYFYRIPKEFNKIISCVKILETLDNKKIEEPVNGILTEIYNYDTGQYEQIYLAYIGDDISLNEYDEVVFKIKKSDIIETKDKKNSKDLSYKKTIPINN